MHRDIKEMLVGSAGIVLFGIALIRWPWLALLIDHYAFGYIRSALHWLMP